MKCHRFKYILDEFLDGELSRDQADDMFRHIAACSECKNLYDGRIQLFSIMKATSQESWSENVVDDVMSKISSINSPGRSSTFNLPLVIAAGFALVFCVGVFFIGFQSFLGGITLADAARTLLSFFETPEDINTGLHEVILFGQGWIIAIKAVLGSLAEFLGGVPAIVIPVLLLGIMVGLGLWLNRNKEAKTRVSAQGR